MRPKRSVTLGHERIVVKRTSLSLKIFLNPLNLSQIDQVESPFKETLTFKKRTLFVRGTRMKNLVLVAFLCLLVTGQSTVQASELEFTSCDDKITCLQKDAFLQAMYSAQAGFSAINAVCAVIPELTVTKATILLSAGIGVATAIVKTLPCDPEVQNYPTDYEIKEEICRLTNGYYSPIFDRCER